MSISFVKAPKPIDFAGNGLEFQLSGGIETTPSFWAYMTLRLDTPLFGYFQFYDIELEQLFRIDAVASPDVTKNEIYYGLNTAQLVAYALNSIFQFRKYYTAKVLGSYVQVYRNVKGAFAWAGKYTLPSTMSLVGNVSNGQTGTVKSNYSIFAQLYNIVNQLDTIINEFNYNVDKLGKTGPIYFGPIVKSYINTTLPSLLNRLPFFRNMDKFYILFSERYDVDGISTICRAVKYEFYALKGKITPELTAIDGLISEIQDNKIYLNHFTSRDIFSGARYLLNFINLNPSAETVLVKAKIFYTDLTYEIKTIYSISTTDDTEIHSFYADPTSMNLASFNPTKEIYKYEVSVERLNTPLFGRLYSWPVVNNANFAPPGWHVPTVAEVNELIAYVGGEMAAGKLKETGTLYFDSPNLDATNEFSFNGRAAGSRENEVSYGFHYLKSGCYLWTKTDADPSYAYFWGFSANSIQFSLPQIYLKRNGYSARFIKDTDDYTVGETLTDLDGNVYRTCKIGNQVWLADNWACKKLNNGAPIPNITDNTAWGNDTYGAYCDYSNNVANSLMNENDIGICNSFTFKMIAPPMFVKEFLFLNKFGAWEIFHLVSKENIDLQLDKVIVKLADNQFSDAYIEAYNKYKTSTGSLTRADALELQYMLMSEALYEIKDDTYTKLIIEPGSIPIIEDSADITSEEFSYRKSTDL